MSAGAVMWRQVWSRPNDPTGMMMCGAVETGLKRASFRVQRVFHEGIVALEIKGRREDFRQAMRHVPECGKSCPAWYREERNAATLERWRVHT